MNSGRGGAIESELGRRTSLRKIHTECVQAAGANPSRTTRIRGKPILEAICQSVFSPRRFAQNAAAYGLATRYGWILIAARWLYYSVAFQFRDYQGSWKPFVAPPFGLSTETYARLQRWLAVPFGFVMMLALAACLAMYLRLLRKRPGFAAVFNIVAVTFFLPFVLLQPCDRLMIALAGWRMLPTIVLHTAVLVWESWAATEIVSAVCGLSRVQRLGGIAILCASWIAVAASVWR